MNRYALMIALVFGLAACADEAVQGTEAADNCNEVECPAGTSPVLQSEAESACGGSADVDRGMTDLGVSASAQCFGSGSCSLICDPPAACCGGEKWTDTSYECETPCAAVCSCDGKCGTVTGADCEADCGDCSGGQVCSADNVCVDECPEGAEVCGDFCFFPIDGDVCVNGEICESAKNCEGMACGSDGCGGDCGQCPGSESCDNGQCVNDCKGSLPVCQGEVIQACQSTNPDDADAGWAWQDDTDCDTPGAETPFCAELASGATCVECNSDADDQCGVGKACDLENGVCVDTCVPDCNNEDGTKRYCGGDGCGGFCDDVDYSCNGNGNWCNPENGKCDTPLEECTFSFQESQDGEPTGNWTKVVIPYGNPFCNSVVPDLGIILDDELPPEAVVSGHVEMGTPDENGSIAAPFDNICTWSIHEFDSGDKTKCGEQICSMVQIPSDQNPIDYIKKTKLDEEDFCCKEPSSCEDFGVQEDQPFCNHADHPAFQTHKSDPWCAGDTPEPIEEGILLRCTQKGKVTEFKCDDCEEGDDGAWSSACSQEGYGCFTGVVGSCSGEEGPCDNMFPEGTELGSCQESNESYCENYEPFCLEPQSEEEGAAGSKNYSGCTWDPVTNEVDEFSDITLCEGNTICVGAVYTDEEKPPCNANEGACGDEDPGDGPWWWKSVPATCQEADPCPSNGQVYDEYCNAADNPGHDPQYPETMRMRCQVQNGVAVIGPKYASDNGNESDCSWDNGNQYGFPAICTDTVNEDGLPSTKCGTDYSTACENPNYFEATCGVIEGENPWDEDVKAPWVCTYDAETNEANTELVACDGGTVCVDHDWLCQPGDPTNCYPEPNYAAVCAPKNDCPAKADFLPDEWANDFCNEQGAPGYQDQFGYGVLTCDYNDTANATEWGFSPCGDGNECYSGGLDPHPDNEGGPINAQCADPNSCEGDEAMCVDNGPAEAAGGSSQGCNYDAATNTKWLELQECAVGEACYYADGDEQYSSDWALETKPECIDRSCGASGANGQPGCWDLNDECHLPSAPGPDPTGVFEEEAFAHFVETGMGPMPTYACLPTDSCPTGGNVWEYTWPDGEDIETSFLIANSGLKGADAGGLISSHYFGTAESTDEIGFAFVCRKMSDGSVVYPNNPDTVFVPTDDYMAQPPFEGGGSDGASTKYCGYTGGEVSVASVRCCGCAYSTALDIKMSGGDDAINLAWCTANCDKGKDDQDAN